MLSAFSKLHAQFWPAEQLPQLTFTCSKHGDILLLPLYLHVRRQQ